MSLEPRLLADLRSLAADLQARKEFLPAARLERLYALFRVRFGPEALAGLDGQELLLKMHGRGDARDSLAYWLEFKNDDEFPTPSLGGIGGGSALKFGIYRRAETGQWMTGTGIRQIVITAEEAAVIAGKQRDELVAGARILEQARRDPSTVDYTALQAAIESAAPTLHHLGWVHKYLSLLAPEVLDDYHHATYQRHHLIKLQLRPLGEGLYINGGLFLAASRELGLPINHFTEMLNHRHRAPKRVWKVGTTSDPDGQDEWSVMRDGNYAAIGWHELGDLRPHLEAADLRDRLQQLYQREYPDNEQGVRTRAVNQVARFIRDVELGDTIVAVRGLTVRGVGEVTGDYEFRDAVDFPHARAVRWLDVNEWRLPINEKPRQTIAELTDVDNLLAIEQRLTTPTTHSPVPAPAAPEQPLPAFIQRIAELLEHKPQIVLHGPPGTGKSYWAEQAARELAARDWFGRRFGALTEAERESLTNPGGAIEMCTFHPGYGYEDFVEGLRPTVVQGQLAFELRDGLFKQLCRRAAQRPDRRFFLVIDEINRGDLPRIFGELLTVLEADKRRWSVTLALSQERFVVPPNVAILATMNTADRSIALLDAALRRRFAFHELMPDPAALGDSVVLGLPLGPLLGWINESLVRALGAGMRHLQIGHAYLMHNRQPIADPTRLAEALRNDIVPLLEEYCHDQRQHLRSIVGAGLFRGNSLEVDVSLFAPANRERLAAALREHFADRLRTPEIVDLIARAEGPEDES